MIGWALINHGIDKQKRKYVCHQLMINNILENYYVFVSTRILRLYQQDDKPKKNLYCQKNKTVQIIICEETSFLDTNYEIRKY